MTEQVKIRDDGAWWGLTFPRPAGGRTTTADTDWFLHKGHFPDKLSAMAWALEMLDDK